MRYIIAPRIDRDDTLAYAKHLGEELIRAGHTVFFEEGSAAIFGSAGVSISDAKDIADLIVAVGGDGTVLRTVAQMKRQIPIIGVNRGEVGFLADLEPENALAFLKDLKPDFPVEERMRLSLQIDGKEIGEALNEALIVTTRPAKMLRFSIVIDGIVAETFRADGMIIGTPTGSTAYAMSAGGPIVDPGIEGVLIVPLAPYMLSSRPHLISTGRDFEIRLDSDKPAHLVIDGVEICSLGLYASITVRSAEEPALFISSGRSFFEKVDQKLRRL